MFDGTVRHLLRAKTSCSTQTMNKFSNQQWKMARPLVMAENQMVQFVVLFDPREPLFSCGLGLTLRVAY
jgi:hypothetical protein